MKQIRKRLTYANVMSSIAVFLVIGGATAFAALGKNSVGAKQLKKNSVTTAKIKKEAVNSAKLKASSVTNTKIADNSVTTPKLQDNSVSTGKIIDSSVTAGKLVEAERSQAFQTWQEGNLSGEISEGLLGNYATATSVVSRTLSPGEYVVTASTEFQNSSLANRSAICRLYDDGVEIGEGSTVIGPLIIVTQGTATVTGVSDGGALNLRCRADDEKVFAFNRKITAIRVGSVG